MSIFCSRSLANTLKPNKYLHLDIINDVSKRIVVASTGGTVSGATINISLDAFLVEKQLIFYMIKSKQDKEFISKRKYLEADEDIYLIEMEENGVNILSKVDKNFVSVMAKKAGLFLDPYPIGIITP